MSFKRNLYSSVTSFFKANCSILMWCRFSPTSISLSTILDVFNQKYICPKFFCQLAGACTFLFLIRLLNLAFVLYVLFLGLYFFSSLVVLGRGQCYVFLCALFITTTRLFDPIGCCTWFQPVMAHRLEECCAQFYLCLLLMLKQENWSGQMTSRVIWFLAQFYSQQVTSCECEYVLDFVRRKLFPLIREFLGNSMVFYVCPRIICRAAFCFFFLLLNSR